MGKKWWKNPPIGWGASTNGSRIASCVRLPLSRRRCLDVKEQVPPAAKAPAGVPSFLAVKSRGPEQLLDGQRNDVRGWGAFVGEARADR